MIPQELTRLPQWVLWRDTIKPDGTRTKLPYAITGQLAATDKPSTWTTFDNVIQASHRLKMGIGFVLTKDDPYALIDLDDPFKHNPTEAEAKVTIARHNKILESFDSYSELSPSGKGMHIIVRCETGVPRGIHPPNLCMGIFSDTRYMTVTGSVFHNRPIADRTFLLQELWKECGGQASETAIVVQEKAQSYSDEEIFNQAKEAQNGEKFFHLWQGHWVDAGYKSQSEADFSLINILSFYSRNVEQIRRMFLMSGLGKRDKAHRPKYVDDMIQKSFDNQPIYIPLDILKGKLIDQLKASSAIQFQEPVANPFSGPLFANEKTQYDWTIPPGLLGDIASFIYESSPRPVKEIALAGAIGMMSGICGRSFNISKTGLNQYILLLAGTGTGKEAMAGGIAKLMHYVKLKCNAATDFIGPSGIASGQALIKFVTRNPCFVSIVGEFGLMLQAMCSHSANASMILLRKTLLELYNKSGETDVLQPTIYSEKEKNTEILRSPSFSLLGESTPEAYYGGLDETMITEGLLPRFMTIQYTGPRVHLNENHGMVAPDDRMVTQIADLCTSCLVMAENKRVLHVELDPQARKFEREFGELTDNNINNSDIIVAKELWNRAHLKMLKLSALIAIGMNPMNPVVTLECVLWAHGLVERDIQAVFERFESGKIGKNTSESYQLQELSTVIKDYLFRPFDITLQRYMVDPRMHADRVISLAYIQRRLITRNSFKGDRMGATMAIKRAIEAMVSDGALAEIRQFDTHKRYAKTAKVYNITDLSRFMM